MLGFGHIKTQPPGSSFYESRWLWRHLCQQDTVHCSKCGAATHKHKNCTKAQLWPKCMGHHCACPSSISPSIVRMTRRELTVPGMGVMWNLCRVQARNAEQKGPLEWTRQRSVRIKWELTEIEWMWNEIIDSGQERGICCHEHDNEH